MDASVRPSYNIGTRHMEWNRTHLRNGNYTMEPCYTHSINHPLVYLKGVGQDLAKS